jgi:hypothetical protein
MRDFKRKQSRSKMVAQDEYTTTAQSNAALGLDHEFAPDGAHPRFCGLALEDGMCGWAEWLHPNNNEEN